jgi:hypothetical protein
MTSCAIRNRYLEEARREGQWVYLANCHLSLSWMPRLAKIVDTLEEEPPHPDFLLWLSSSPTPQFPISILQVRVCGGRGGGLVSLCSGLRVLIRAFTRVFARACICPLTPTPTPHSLLSMIFIPLSHT